MRLLVTTNLTITATGKILPGTPESSKSWGPSQGWERGFWSGTSQIFFLGFFPCERRQSKDHPGCSMNSDMAYGGPGEHMSLQDNS